MQENVVAVFLGGEYTTDEQPTYRIFFSSVFLFSRISFPAGKRNRSQDHRQRLDAPLERRDYPR